MCRYTQLNFTLHLFHYIPVSKDLWVGRYGPVCIATHYGMEGPGIEFRCGRDFPHLSRPALGPTQPPKQCVPSLLPGRRAVGAWR